MIRKDTSELDKIEEAWRADADVRDTIGGLARIGLFLLASVAVVLGLAYALASFEGHDQREREDCIRRGGTITTIHNTSDPGAWACVGADGAHP